MEEHELGQKPDGLREEKLRMLSHRTTPSALAHPLREAIVERVQEDHPNYIAWVWHVSDVLIEQGHVRCTPWVVSGMTSSLIRTLEMDEAALEKLHAYVCLLFPEGEGK